MRSSLFLTLFATGALAGVLQAPWSVSDKTTSDNKVPVILGVMSKCPDAVLCEAVFDRVLKVVGDKVDLSLTYVARINASEPEYGVTCLHGPSECAGNIEQLCAAKHFETDNWWRFVQCQNFHGKDTVGNVGEALACAKASDIDADPDSKWAVCSGIHEEIKGEEGVRLLEASAKRTAELGIQKSCTVVINGKHVCIRDSTWKDCPGGHEPEDFIRQINDEYKRLNEAA